MEILKTPPSNFNDLPGYSFQAHYINVGTLHELSMHYVDYGPRNGPVILMLHGEPSWSYLYRNMINIASAEGYRVIAPDLIGFGKSDKYANQDAYTFANHLAWLRSFIDHLAITNIHLICHDWGGMLGLRLVAEDSKNYAAVVVSNTILPTGEQKPTKAFLEWQEYSQTTKTFDIAGIIQRATHKEIIPEVIAAYNAPFPSEKYKAGARKFPLLVPTRPDDPEALNNIEAWKSLERFSKPFLTVYSDQDPITKGGETLFQERIPGCAGQEHTILKNGGHFLEEDCAQEFITLAINCFKGCTHG